MNTSRALLPAIESVSVERLSLVEIPLEDLDHVAGGWGLPGWAKTGLEGLQRFATFPRLIVNTAANTYNNIEDGQGFFSALGNGWDAANQEEESPTTIDSPWDMVVF